MLYILPGTIFTTDELFWRRGPRSFNATSTADKDTVQHPSEQQQDEIPLIKTPAPIHWRWLLALCVGFLPVENLKRNLRKIKNPLLFATNNALKVNILQTIKIANSGLTLLFTETPISPEFSILLPYQTKNAPADYRFNRTIECHQGESKSTLHTLGILFKPRTLESHFGPRFSPNSS